MSAYARVYRKIWSGETFSSITDPTARLVALYLLTNDHGNTEGYYRLPMPLAVHELGISPGDYLQALDDLADFAMFDPATEIVFLVNGLKHQPPKGAKSVAGAVNSVKPLRRSFLGAFFEAAAERFAPEFAQALQKCPEWDPQPCDQGKQAPSKGHRRGFEGASISLAPSPTPTPAPTPAPTPTTQASCKTQEGTSEIEAFEVEPEPTPTNDLERIIGGRITNPRNPQRLTAAIDYAARCHPRHKVLEIASNAIGRALGEQADDPIAYAMRLVTDYASEDPHPVPSPDATAAFLDDLAARPATPPPANLRDGLNNHKPDPNAANLDHTHRQEIA